MMTRRPPRTEQLSLALPSTPAMGRDDFLRAPSNALALATIEAEGGLPAGLLVLTGPEGSGKTHLAHVWTEANGAAWLPPAALPGAVSALLEPGAPRALAIDDAERIAGTEAEEALFHLVNHLRGRGQILLCARRPVRDWGLRLPDLVSRLSAAAHVALAEPDEALLAAVLVKLFADRQIRVQPPLIDYLLGRMERSLAAAGGIVARLDERALQLRRPVTRALAQDLLAEDDGPPPPPLDKPGPPGAS